MIFQYHLFGCGSGYDTQFFLRQNYTITAIDPSIKSWQKASKRTGLQVKRMSFQELEDIAQYHGIWVWDSILHLPYLELKSVLFKMARALKKMVLFMHHLSMELLKEKERENISRI